MASGGAAEEQKPFQYQLCTQQYRLDTETYFKNEI